MSKPFIFHHVGIAVADLDKAVTFYAEVLGFDLMSGPFDDPIQKVRVCFLGNAVQDTGVIEIIFPLDINSPVNGYLSQGLGTYHVCYEVAELQETLVELRSKGCVVISSPTPAVAFEGRSIAWCFTPTRQLIELLESQAACRG